MVISAAVHYSVPRRYSNPNPHQAFSLVQQHELDGPLLSEEALELQVGTRRTSLGSRMLVIKAVVVNVHLLSAGRQREAQGGGCLLGQAPGGRRRRAAAAAPLCEGRDRRPRAGEPHPPPSPSPLTAHLSPFTLTFHPHPHPNPDPDPNPNPNSNPNQAGVAKWLQPLLAEGKVEVQAAVLQACYLVITPRGMVEVQAAVLQAPRSCRLA